MKFIEILIGLILVYAILSVLVSSLAEWWNHRKKKRGKLLKESIYNMLDDSIINVNYGYLLMNHPLVSSMQRKGSDRPFQYLDSSIFSDALIDIIGAQNERGKSINDSSEEEKITPSLTPEKDLMDRFINGVSDMNHSPFQTLMEQYYLKSKGNYRSLKKLIEHWYNMNQERATGWFKTKQRNTLLVFSFIVAIGLNVDSIHVFRVISMDSELRSNLNEIADGMVEEYENLPQNDSINYDQQIKSIILKFDSYKKDDSISSFSEADKLFIQNKLDNTLKLINLNDSINNKYKKSTYEIIDVIDQLGIPIGWSSETAPISWFTKSKHIKKHNNTSLNRYLFERNTHTQFNENGKNERKGGVWFLWLLGIIITGFAISHGATFWFDILVKLVNIRKAGSKPQPTIRGGKK